MFTEPSESSNFSVFLFYKEVFLKLASHFLEMVLFAICLLEVAAVGSRIL
jgi:hypothetical protein